jgi:predicted DNA-binding transcriptional regulator AlpA
MSSPPCVSPAAPAAADIVPELLTAAQAARLCGIGQRTLWRWSRSGLAPRPVKIGCGLRAAVRYRRTELLAWCAAGCPTAERGADR